MKKKTRPLVLFAGVLALACLAAGLRWFTAKPNYVTPAVRFGDLEVEAAGRQWNTRVFPGVYKPSQDEFADIALVVSCPDTPALTVTEENWQAQVTVARDGTLLFIGTPAEYNNTFAFEENGAYDFALTLTRPRGEGDWGTLAYRFTADVNLVPTCTFLNTRGEQGDIFTLAVENLAGSEAPTGECALGTLHFFRVGRAWAAVLGAGYGRTPGEYPITVQAGGQVFEETLTVTARDWDVQYMEIDEDTYNSTAGSAQASAQYRADIWPLYTTADDTRYWTGAFAQPVFAEISTEYGLYRYVNGAYAERHSGIDFAADGGVPVACPAGGRVVYAGLLQLSGNTVVVEHGGGMKSYFFHMRSLSVAQGDLVSPGDEIGLVGATGYATGDHLHYEVKIGTESVNPWRLFDGTSSIFRLDSPPYTPAEE